jgi:predicted DNA-binding protein (UPF0278 family)
MQCTVKHVQKSSAYCACLAALCYSVTIAVNLLKERVMQNISYTNAIKLASKAIADVVEDMRDMIDEGDTTTLDSCLEDLNEILRLQNALTDYIETANAEQLAEQFKQNYANKFEDTELIAYLK